MKTLKALFAAILFLVLAIGCRSTANRDMGGEQLEGAQTNQENEGGLWEPWSEPGWP